jgi:hypothetical protein
LPHLGSRYAKQIYESMTFFSDNVVLFHTDIEIGDLAYFIITDNETFPTVEFSRIGQAILASDIPDLKPWHQHIRSKLETSFTRKYGSYLTQYGNRPITAAYEVIISPNNWVVYVSAQSTMSFLTNERVVSWNM